MKSSVGVKRFVLAAIIVALAACRGEPVPRDYQNAPPAMTHPPQTKSDTPTANGMPGAAPEPSSGAEGKDVPPDAPVSPPAQSTGSTTIPDTPPATTTT